MKKVSLTIMLVITLSLFAGCNNQQEQETKTQNVNYTKVKYGSVVNQSPSEQAKSIVQKREETTDVRAVNSDRDLYVAFNVETFDRFQLDDIEAEVKKELKRKFPDYQIQVSTDKKVLLELESLEGKLNNGEIKDKKELSKKLKHIKHVKNDQ